MALAASCTCSAFPTTASLRDNTFSESPYTRTGWTTSTGASTRSRVIRTTTTASLPNSNASAELHSRRSVVQTGGVLGFLTLVDRFPAFAEEDTDVNSTASTKLRKAPVDTESWYRFRGEGFRMTIPPDYEDLVEFDDSGTSLYGERAKEKPFAARFASPDRKAVLSVVVRNGSQLKLSFLQTQDITEFGSLEEAAKVFVPAGSKIVAAAALKPTDSRVPRTYYLYEFLAKDDKRVVISAAAAGGRVFVFGAMAPNSRWKEVGGTMRSAAVNFALL